MSTSEDLRKRLQWLNMFRRRNLFRSPLFTSAIILADDAINELAEKEKEIAELKKQLLQ